MVRARSAGPSFCGLEEGELFEWPNVVGCEFLPSPLFFKERSIGVEFGLSQTLAGGLWSQALDIYLEVHIVVKDGHQSDATAVVLVKCGQHHRHQTGIPNPCVKVIGMDFARRGDNRPTFGARRTDILQEGMKALIMLLGHPRRTEERGWTRRDAQGGLRGNKSKSALVQSCHQ